MNSPTRGARLLAATLLALVSCQASADSFGLHLVSHHFGGLPAQNVNLGAFYRWDNGVTLGALRNSEDTWSAYAGWTWSAGPLAVTGGAISGYRDGLRPLLIPSLALGLGFRLAAIAPVGVHRAAVHLMWEHGL